MKSLIRAFCPVSGLALIALIGCNSALMNKPAAGISDSISTANVITSRSGAIAPMYSAPEDQENLRLAWARPYIDQNNVHQIQFRVHTKIGTSQIPSEKPTYVTIHYFSDNTWSSFNLPLLFTGSTYQAYQGDFPSATDTCKFYVSAYYGESASIFIDNNDNNDYCVVNSASTSFAQYKAQGYVAGVAGNNIDLEEAYIVGGSTSNTLRIFACTEVDYMNACKGDYVSAQVSKDNCATVSTYNVSEPPTVYVGSSNLLFSEIDVPNIPTAGIPIIFYIQFGDPAGIGDLNFLQNYTISPVKGSTIH
jgi:hypothetical protein